MPFTGTGFVAWSVDLALILLLAAVALTLIRMARGPSLPDRVVALDLLAVLSIALIAVFAVATEQTAFLDVAIALALTGFLGTVAFARYAERRRRDRRTDRA